ncbi:MAG: TetR family transcriptional regulator, partial [Nannocystaceae bacterium]|nr:TetR family transcriptional regulator [Nannocystaceae bacterium]
GAILDAAMSIVIADGLAGLTLGKVAKHLDVAVGGLYRYFPCKEDLVVGLQRRAVERFGARLEHHVPPTPRTRRPVAALRHALAPFALYAASADTDPLEHRLMDIMLSNLTPSLDDGQAQLVEGVLGPILQRAERGLLAAQEADALAVGDGRQRTLLLWSATHGLGHLRSRDRLEQAPYRVDVLLGAMFEALLVGFGADARHARAAVRPAR